MTAQKPRDIGRENGQQAGTGDHDGNQPALTGARELGACGFYAFRRREFHAPCLRGAAGKRKGPDVAGPLDQFKSADGHARPLGA